MNKKAFFYVDDVIWTFRDIAENMPKSIFNQHFLKILKKAHDMYGLKVVLNCFYRTDYSYGDREFALSDMPDVYKNEWSENSDWLKIGYHSKQEFPDYPLVNANYDDVKNEYMRFLHEVTRFAGENVSVNSINPHWIAISKEACQALRDCGIKIFSCTHCGTKEYEPNLNILGSNAFRLMQNHKPESIVINKGGFYSLASYNHMKEDEIEETKGTFKTIYKKELGIHFKRFDDGVFLNSIPLDKIESKIKPALNDEYVGNATHEQYAFPEYCGYQPDTEKKILKMCQILKEHNYDFFFIDECI